MSVPAVTVAGPLSVTERSTIAVTDVVTVAALFVVFGSANEDVTVAVLLIVPNVMFPVAVDAIAAVRVIDALVPEGSDE
jgi:preprotein translocase subunit SecB